jgi:hypothetical protein
VTGVEEQELVHFVYFVSSRFEWSSEPQRGRVTGFSCDGVYARLCEKV